MKSTPGVIAFFSELENDGLMKLELLLVVLREAYISSNDHLIMALLDSDAYQLQSQPYTYQIHVAIAMGLVNPRTTPGKTRETPLSPPRRRCCLFETHRLLSIKRLLWSVDFNAQQEKDFQ